ncbi:hypothetical protein M422DRAFT_229848 [Sphaerobolus stellatus SS14]|uniref:F-box domain-containing protein n=1 Tax=Sphaerobolus stellatus (strain SS14) TaxID=990650 RepID=A0A0C9UJ22_SPHS4|nr:hypothetical protein M422DRAFT_216814 [Sphaerobolus stellatus SS14]KIJ41053.1 hypothetical protein M422DRAFT_229848 [Sphaerobolus stellatus SS14]
MIIPTEKQVPPPAYEEASPRSMPPPPFSQSHYVPKLDGLPPNILLHIVNTLFPAKVVDATVHRKTLYWLATSLRLVSRGMYIACMHTLRSAYLSSYAQLIKQPYSSDPFPAIAPSRDLSPVLHPGHRETKVLDLYIAVKVREDVWLDESELHLEAEDCFKDLFDLMQPRSRTEDLIAQHGVDMGLITMSPVGNKGSVTPIPFSLLTVTFSPRTLGLLMSSRTKKRTIVECHRERNERLEVSAKRLVKELKRWAEQQPTSIMYVL